MVSRAVILERAATIWPTATVPYSQVKVHQPDGYRQDCSGFASLCWALAPAGQNTVTLVTGGFMVPIGVDELLPGDAVGKCGPGTEGDAGHIQIVSVYNHATGSIEVWEQAGGVNGPRLNKYKRITPGFTAWRFVGVGPTPPPVPPRKAAVTGMIGIRDPEGGEFTAGMSPLAIGGYFYAPVGDIARSIALQAGGVIMVPNTRPGVFGPSAEQVRKKLIDDIAAAVVAKLPPGGGGGITVAQVAAAVRSELDRTKLGGF